MDEGGFSGYTGLLRNLLRSSMLPMADSSGGTTPPLSPRSARAVRKAAQRRDSVGAVPASARSMQWFLTESPWDDDAVMGRLQEYLGPRLEHPEAV